ncbi:MAG: prepilin peptidase [Sedimentibacter sp.]|uniref:prepilin peptidase n=1 Tax=Sedimentibacter sp. TaxID=1960295 RepID=UPI003159491B
MYIQTSMIFGIIGLAVGLGIQNISYKLIKFKRGKFEVSENVFLHSMMLRILLGAFNGAAWAITGLFTDNFLLQILICTQITVGLIVSYIDISIRIIPNEIVLIIITMGMIFQTSTYGLYGILGSIMSMVFIMIVFTALAMFMGMGKVGAGDVKLAGAIGFTLGYPLVITAIWTMAISLIIFILIGFLLKKIKLSTMLPLGPFLSLGYAFSLVYFVLNNGLN